MTEKKEWNYEGYNKVKTGRGRNARMEETWIYRCSGCGKTISIPARTDTPAICPNCNANMKRNDNRKRGNK